MYWFIAALVSINNPGLTTNLRFTITTDKNGIRDVEVQNRNSMTCTIMISGSNINLKLTSSNIINIYSLIFYVFSLKRNT